MGKQIKMNHDMVGGKTGFNDKKKRESRQDKHIRETISF